MPSALGECETKLPVTAIQCWFVFAVILLLSSIAEAAERPEGLMWNRSGLAATLPLQVKTKSGSDFLLLLREVGSEEAVLAAYIRGGEFFRVLTPPGSYDLLFVSGTEWHGEVAQFGPDSRRFVLYPPLTFGATASRKNGYLVDLRDAGNITIRDLAICQRLEFDLNRYLGHSHRRAEDPVLRPEPYPYVQHLDYRYYPHRYEVRSRVCE